VEPSGGFLVQLSAVRSREQAQATYAGLQRSYPSILGDLEPVIVEADLGDRGIYYRVRVGPWEERADAVRMCESLTGAGGSCFVTQ
jgi:hypothetical protein